MTKLRVDFLNSAKAPKKGKSMKPSENSCATVSYYSVSVFTTPQTQSVKCFKWLMRRILEKSRPIAGAIPRGLFIHSYSSSLRRSVVCVKSAHACLSVCLSVCRNVE